MTTSNNTAPETLTATRAKDLPWVPWAMPGAQFKLLSADLTTGRFTLMIKVEKDSLAPIHRHVGAVEAFLLEGSFHYHDQPEIRFEAGDYLLEKDGAIHRPISPEGAIMIGVFHGPVEGLDEAGQLIGRVDCAWHIRTWEKALASLGQNSAN